MITQKELRTISQQKRLSLQNTEKDYLLELLLFILSEQQRTLVFKGGTALYKFYNLNRFSEDLDFDSTGKRIHVQKITKHIQRHLELLGMKRTLHEIQEYQNETNIRLHVRGPTYDGSKQSMTRVTLNISKKERPQEPLQKFLVTNYPEIPSFHLTVLSSKEIAAEKIRCIYTREKPRDVYDLWFLSQTIQDLSISLINTKLKLYNIAFHSDVFEKKLTEKQSMWNHDLEPFIIGTLPSFDIVKTEVLTWISSLKKV